MKHFLRHGPWKNFKDYLRFSSGWYNFAWSFSKWDKLGLMPRRGAWVAETTGLLNQHTSNCITGSNPVLSAETVPNFGTVFFFTPCTEITENYIFRKKCNFFSKFIRGTFAEYVFITYICTNDWLFEMLKKNIRFLYGEIGSLLNCRAGQLAPRVRIPSSPPRWKPRGDNDRSNPAGSNTCRIFSFLGYGQNQRGKGSETGSRVSKSLPKDLTPDQVTICPELSYLQPNMAERIYRDKKRSQ